MNKSLPVFLLYFSFFTIHSSFSQGPITVELNRQIKPSVDKRFGLTNYFYDTLHLVSSTGKDSLVRRIDNYKLAGGDFADGKVKFTIIVNTANKGNLAWLAPYGADSTIVTGSSYGSSEIKNGSLLVIKAYGKEYSATIDKEATFVTLQQLSGHYSKPDIYLYDSLMPDSKFELFGGGTSSFASYKHQHKYIYVIYWYGWQPGDTREIDALKNVSDLYKDALTVISIHSSRADTAVIKQMEKDKNIDWVEIKDGFAAEGDFPSNGRTLFNEEGKAIVLNLWPQELKAVIEKLLHVAYSNH